MSNYDNTNRGTLGKNKRKELDTHPDYAGSINVEGVEYWLNGWLKTNGQDGSKFFSLSVKPKKPKADAGSEPAPAKPADTELFNDDIPF